ncbi:MAG: uroporphyrinogen-III synthase [Rhizobiales bacterium]|nr:uroporphyrinogen-III synthase [Hyphomicrobiales bacterium]
MRLLVTRPREDALPLADALGEIGHEVIVAPLLDILFRDEVVLPEGPFQALLITSANGARALARRGDVATLKPLRVFTVGAASADAMLAAGFRWVESADGDVDSLAAAVSIELSPVAGPLLHVAGSVVAGDLTSVLAMQGFETKRAVLYEARVPSHLPTEIVDGLSAGNIDGALFFSLRTAKSFLQLVEVAGLMESAREITFFCLSPNVAQILREAGFSRCLVASEPTQAALLRLIAARKA